MNAHFHISRLISKIAVPNTESSRDRARFLVGALKRYEWLSNAAPKYCAIKDISVGEIFHTELELCREMTVLLPTRIDRMHYLGNSS